MAFKDPIVAGETLVRDAIKSPDYVQYVSGWAVNGDGSIEATDLLIRGADGCYIRAYIEPVNGLPVIDFHPADPVNPGWSVAAGSLYEYPDGAGYEVVGLSSPVQYQPDATGEAKLELRSGQAADPTSSVLITADAVLISSGNLLDGTNTLVFLRGQRGLVSVTINSGTTSGTVAVGFPIAFPVGTVPHVSVNINSGAGGTGRCFVRAINITRTGFTLFVESPTTAINLAWVAQAVGWIAVL